MRYLRNFALCLDQLANSLLAGDNVDETISSAVGRKARAGRRWAIAAEGVIDAIFAIIFGERHHCENNVEAQFDPGEQ